jgi:hypothetical protein
VKDLSELHCTAPDRFDEKLKVALEAATPWAEIAQAEKAAVTEEAWEKCKYLAGLDNILDKLIESLAAIGLAGERGAAQIIYLILTSRLLQRLVSAILRGPSAGGKNFLLDMVLKHFPPEAIIELTGMSEHALVYLLSLAQYVGREMAESRRLEGSEGFSGQP